MNASLVQSAISSPIGPIRLFATDRGLRGVLLVGEKPGRLTPADDALPARGHHVLAQAEEELGRYFAGDLTRFDVPLDLAGSLFQLAVWEQLSRIPFAETISYGELSRRVGGTANPRAVGSANGRNTVSIIVPCHRVIGSNGHLVGYAGGIETKAELLRHEREVCERRGLAVGELRLPI